MKEKNKTPKIKKRTKGQLKYLRRKRTITLQMIKDNNK